MNSAVWFYHAFSLTTRGPLKLSPGLDQVDYETAVFAIFLPSLGTSKNALQPICDT